MAEDGSGDFGDLPPNSSLSHAIPQSLIRYERPYSINTELKRVDDDDEWSCKEKTIATLNWTPDPYAVSYCRDSGGSAKRELREILNMIAPPFTWTEDGLTWKQAVSSEGGGRDDIMYLNAELAHQLKVKQARESGICYIRRELYGQAFGELIRQVSVDCPERGLLLLRIRDEAKMNIGSYEALNDTSSIFGTQKSAEATYRVFKKVKKLEHERNKVGKEVADLEEKIKLLHRTYIERKEADEKHHFERVQFLKRANQLLRQQYESLANFKY